MRDPSGVPLCAKVAAADLDDPQTMFVPCAAVQSAFRAPAGPSLRQLRIILQQPCFDRCVSVPCERQPSAQPLVGLHDRIVQAPLNSVDDQNPCQYTGSGPSKVTGLTAGVL